MLETNSGNHIAQQAEREYNYEPKCSCGSKVWEAVEVCEFEKSIECNPNFCKELKFGFICMSKCVFKCLKCGHIERD